MRTMKAAAALMLVVLVAGCAQPEDRINAARPPADGIIAAHAALLATAGAFGADATAIDAEYDARLRQRARECGHGYSPGPFTGEAAMREALRDHACFDTRDRALRQWLELRRVGLLLAAPALRPLPPSPRPIIAGSPVRGAEFAAQAGVGLLRTPGGHQILDLATGRALYRGDDGEAAQGLSANGRVFLVAAASTLEVRAAESGERLARLENVPAKHFHWLGMQAAIFHRDDGHAGKLVFVDLRSGRETLLAAAATRIQRVAPLSGAPRRYGLVSLSRASELELREDRDGTTAVLLAERVLPTAAFADRAVAMTADGRHLVGVEGSLQVLDLATLRARSVPLTPFRPQRVALTADPDVLWLEGRFPDAGLRSERYLYSVAHQTLARVDDARLPATDVLYVPALRRNATIGGDTITWLDVLPHAPPVAAQAMLDDRAAMAFALAREQALDMPAIARARLARSRALDAQARATPPAATAGTAAAMPSATKGASRP